MSGGSSAPAPLGVCVFCGSRFGRLEAFEAVATALGHALGRNGWRLVYGGGDVGLMGTIARASLAAGAEVLGIIPQRLLDREVGKRDLTELQITPSMFARKERMMEVSDAFVVLPGGFGTIDELLDAVTLRQLGYHDKPILLLDLDGFWQPAMALFRHVVEAGFAEPAALELVELHPDVPAVTARLARLQAQAGDARA